MNTTVGGISKMLGENPTHKRVLYIAAQMLREDPCNVKNKIFALQFYMGMVAGCAGWHKLVSAIDTYTTAIEKL
jgi:hypothetical protein